MGLLYLGNATFRQHFHDRIIYPCKNPQNFHPDHLPLQRTFAIYGQKGNHKRSVVELLLEQNGISFVTLTVAFAYTTEFCDRFVDLMSSQQYDLSKSDVPLVIVIERADILVHEPDDKSVTRLTTKLEQIAAQKNWLIVALFDRHRSADSDPYKDAFYAQFPYVSVLSSPATDKQFITEFYKQKFDSFCKTYNFTNALQEHEYQMLADVSVYATVSDLSKFCEAIFFDLFKTGVNELTYGQHVEVRFKTTAGIVHIDTIMYQMAKMVDEQFTSLIGIMPAVKKQQQQQQQKRQRIEVEEEEEMVKEEEEVVKMEF